MTEAAVDVPVESRPRMLHAIYANPGAYPPLIHAIRVLLAQHWRIAVVGAASGGTDALKFPQLEGVRVTTLPSSHRGWRQKLHYLRFALALMLEASRRRPDIVYISDAFACPAGLVAATVWGARIVYHEHDTPDTAHRTEPWGEGSWVEGIAAAARRKVIARAGALITPRTERAPELFDKSQTGRVFEVWNCPERGDALTQNAAESSGPLRLLYHGSIVPDRLPSSLIEIVAAAGGALRLEIVGYSTGGHRTYVSELQAHASRSGASDWVRFHGTMPLRSQVLSIARACHLGLCLMPMLTSDVNMRHMAGASNKPFDNLASGLPLLVSHKPEWIDTFVTPGYARSCDPADARSLQRELAWCLENRGILRAMGEAGRQRVLSEWNYEHQFASAAARLASLL